MALRRHIVVWAAATSAVAAAAVIWSQRTAPPSDRGPATFARDVAPIVHGKCAPCHNPGEAAPFSLLTYDDVRRRARQIAEVTGKRLMPPWLPKAGYGDFVNERRLTDDEMQTLAGWAAAGAPRGDESPPEPPAFAADWQAGPPDLVLETPAYKLAGQGQDVFRNFVIPVRLEAARWVRSIELRPTNPRVTHHARLGVDASGESRRRDAADGEPGYPGMAWGQDPDGQLVMWAPGVVARPGDPGVAWRLHPHTSLVLHAHFQPSGKPEVVRFRVGIHFADGPPEKHPALLRIGGCDIDIPAGAKRHVVTDEYAVPVDVDVHTIFPHAHSLCREIQVSAARPDESAVTLIAIEHFDENWHDSYRYRRPVRLPRGTRLVSTFAYDNTDDNVRNRNRPARRVVYGSNAHDEMADVYLQVTAAREDQRAVLMEHYRQYQLRAQAAGYRRTLDLYPDDPWSREGLASCFVGLGEPAKAVPILQKRVTESPREVFPAVALGMAVLAAGDAGAAEARLREAIALDGDYALAWLGLGQALAAQKKPDAAEQAFRRAAELSPASWEARLGLADVLTRRGELEQAGQVCAAAAAASPDVPNVHLKLAEIAARQKLWDESLRHGESARRLAPYTHPPKVLLASFCVADGDPQRGLRFLQEARAEEPAHPVPSLMLGQLARRQGLTKAARDYLDVAASLPPPDTWPDSHRKRFMVLLHSERYRLAADLRDPRLARDAVAEWLKAEPENRQVQALRDRLPADPPRP